MADTPKVITSVEIAIYEARTQAMLQEACTQRDDAQFKLVNAMGEVGSLKKRLEQSQANLDSMTNERNQRDAEIVALTAQLNEFKNSASAPVGDQTPP